jgi:DNA-directed RNA polymerase specialized sigma24 family protein
LDDLRAEDALIPHRKNHSKVVFIPEALLDQLSFALPNQETTSVARPQRKACHRLRKLVRSLSGLERKVIRFLYFRDLPRSKVSEKMKLSENELEGVLNHAFAKLREGLRPLIA